MSEPTKIGLTGAGGLGMHLSRGFEDTEDAVVHAVADVSDESRNRAGERLDIPEDRRYSDHIEMLDDAELDGVVVATPHTFHYEQTLAALEREIDTLCEKPMTTDLADAEDLVRRAEDSSATLMIGYQRHLDSAFLTAKEALAEEVGEPTFITAEVTQNWIATQRGTWRTNPDLSGGGQLYDTGSHLLDVVLWTTGLTPVAVDAQMLFDDDEDRVDVQAALTVTFENGAVASVAVSGDTPTVREHLHVWGDNGGFFVEGEDWDPRKIRFIAPDGGERQPRLDRWGSKNKAQAFVDVIRDGAEPPATPRDALKVTAVTEAAYESARTGKRVDIDL
ncbi:Gfo/Idh/MocA family protein [Halogeometricum luteum]|uniref:Gfo/Idh/MocA family oxidoreductase n=1 Tax=Halogeometricum luteum TaxID=2950537 RepID=A0ABU2G5C7_9EURY|nr:Gfo/Idh/MocA family oxidoreductase [Halogeometricum sp. S3BR5-2]MDS0295419.1 Gfo/Idh/MocA family oxidoreductase [Halogeometricum sp. S3BR5-2]